MPPSPPPQGAPWRDWLKWYLCELYKVLGGDCKDLDGPEEARISQVVAYYQAHGAPTFGNPQALQEFLDLLKRIEDWLDKPANDLDKDSDAELRALISSLRGAVAP